MSAFNKVCSRLFFGAAVFAATLGISTAAHANPSHERPTIRPMPSQVARATSQPRVTNPNATSYVGAAGSNDGAVFNGKYAVTNRLSVRPEVFINAETSDGEDGTAVYAPVTFDFNTGTVLGSRFQPFVGVGPGVITSEDGTDFQLVTTAGADYRIGKRYTLNASANYLPLEDDNQVGFVAGLGYNF